jgi:hypothetical protein
MAAFGGFIDHHCHGVVTRTLDRAGLEALMSEAHRPASPFFVSQFEKPLGLAIRRHCAPVLGLEPLASAEAYAERRAALGGEAASRLLLAATGVAAMLIDTGHRAAEIATPPAMTALSGVPAREVVRIEAVFEAAAREAPDAGRLAARFAELLAERARGAAGLKSIVAYRAGFDIAQERPAPGDVTAAADRWLGRIAREGWTRIEDPVLLMHGLHVGLDLAAERRLPIQLHVGFGDSDIRMPACDPTRFVPFIAMAEAREVPVTLLHCYPFEREAGWLAEVFSNVFMDVGVVLNFAGPSAARVLADALELTPFTKQLYSSDAFGLAELHLIGRIQFERAFAAVTDRWIAAGDATAADVDRIAGLIAHGNARRIYPL